MAPMVHKSRLESTMDNVGIDYNKVGLFFAVGTFLVWIVPGYVISVLGASDGRSTSEGYLLVVQMAIRQLGTLNDLVDNLQSEDSRSLTPLQLQERFDTTWTTLVRFNSLHPAIAALIWPLWEKRLNRRTRDLYRSVKIQLNIVSNLLSDTDGTIRGFSSATGALQVIGQRPINTNHGTRRAAGNDLAAIESIDNAIDTVEVRLSSTEGSLDRLERGEDGLRIQLAGLKSTVDEIHHKLIALGPSSYPSPPDPDLGSAASTTLVASSGATRLDEVAKDDYDVELSRPMNADSIAGATVTDANDHTHDQKNDTVDDDAYSTAFSQSHQDEQYIDSQQDRRSQGLVDQGYQAYVRPWMTIDAKQRMLTYFTGAF